MKIIINFKCKTKLGTYHGTPNGTAQGHLGDTNNNDNNNNILFILFNKYKGDFNFVQSLEEKKQTFSKDCMQDELFKELTQEEQTELYTKLMSVM